ncbi:hypothetical protein E2C01_034573 [Portunus trituberculatus]|uniref:Uncharacterized protein n=1 Tax=Portunus trituberculatus TaxID=210409 RepID=A0A5B7F365_PORTR|nr:hypothetical protein [Portunus trituberculatus]
MWNLWRDEVTRLGRWENARPVLAWRGEAGQDQSLPPVLYWAAHLRLLPVVYSRYVMYLRSNKYSVIHCFLMGRATLPPCRRRLPWGAIPLSPLPQHCHPCGLASVARGGVLRSGAILMPQINRDMKFYLIVRLSGLNVARRGAWSLETVMWVAWVRLAGRDGSHDGWCRRGGTVRVGMCE